MKRLAVVVVLVLAAAFTYRTFLDEETGTGSLTLPQPAPNIGSNAPKFEVRTVKGHDFELSDHSVYVLTFWSTLNKDSNEARADFADLAREYGNDGVSFAVVYVNSAPSEDHVPYTMLLDSTGELVSKYNVKRVPRLFVIENGKVDYAQDYFDSDGYKKNLRMAIEEATTEGSEEGHQTALRAAGKH